MIIAIMRHATIRIAAVESNLMVLMVHPVLKCLRLQRPNTCGPLKKEIL